MPKKLNIESFFIQEAEKIINDRKQALNIHKTNIRASGNIVETSVRSFIKDRIPNRFHVGQGHMIDQNHKVSPQLDVLITDVSSLPILLKTNESTDYYPIESVYAFGEIKSTYYKSKKYIEKFCETIKMIKSDMHRVEEKNTAYNGLNNDTLIHHLGVPSPTCIFNPLFTFMVFVDVGDFEAQHFANVIAGYDSRFLPNLVIFVSGGVLIKVISSDKGMGLDFYPEYSKESSEWVFSNLRGDDNFSGINLTVLYFSLLMHLKDCHLGEPDYFKYFQSIMPFSKSRLQVIKHDNS
jgi:hypothetical protein